MTKAAEQLYITQPSLSHAMAELEKELGAFLFEKHGRNIRLTKYGEFFLSYVIRALDELERGEKALKELVSPEMGCVDLAFIYTLGSNFIPQLLSEFSGQPAFSKINFSLMQGNTKDILQSLKAEKIDLAICSMTLPDDRINFEPIAEEEIVLIVPLNHPLAKNDEIAIHEISDFPFVMFNQKSGLRPLIETMLEEAKIVPNIICEVEEDHTMAGFVAHGHGIAILPKFTALSAYQVKVIPLKSPDYHRYIYAATLNNHYLSPAVRAFRDFVVAYGQQNYLLPNYKI